MRLYPPFGKSDYLLVLMRGFQDRLQDGKKSQGSRLREASR